MKKKLDLSIIIVNYNSGNYLYHTVKSITDSPPLASFEIIIVDNRSTDGSLTKVTEQFPEIKILRQDENWGFAKANNIGARAALGDYLLILNNDTEVPEGAVDSLRKGIIENPGYGILSPVLYNEDGTPQLNYGNDPGIFSEFIAKYFLKLFFRLGTGIKRTGYEKDKDWVSGACFIISSELYNELGGFDEAFFLYYEDADLGRRVRERGYKNHITSVSGITHFLGKSTGPVCSDILPLVKRGHLHYYRKHNGRISFHLLKAYLTVRFTLKYWIAGLTGNGKNSERFRDTLAVIRDSK